MPSDLMQRVRTLQAQRAADAPVAGGRVVWDDEPLERGFGVLLRMVFTARPVLAALIFAAGVFTGALLSC